MRDVLLAIYGPDIARQLLAISEEAVSREAVSNQQSAISEEAHPLTRSPAHPLTVSGFVGPPSVHWSNRSHITFFVNGRWVKDNSLTYAVIQAYQTLLPTGRYPLGILFLELPPELVDVNVHPTKTEVRFRQGKTPFSTVQRAVRQTLVDDAPIRSMTAWSMGSSEGHTPGWEGNLDQQAFTNAEQSALGLDWDKSPATDESEEPALIPNERVGGSQLPIMRVIGQIGAAYIITEGPDGLFLIDQHTAHSRVLFEELLGQIEQGEMQQQALPSGTAVTLSTSQAPLLEQNLDRFANLGFRIEPFGPNAFMVRAVPKTLALLDPAQVVVTMMQTLEQNKSLDDNALIGTLGSMAAVKAGQTLTPAEMADIIRQLEACQDPFADENGNPTFIYLSVAQLAREFGRI